MRCRQKVGTSPVPAAPCSHPSPPIAPSVSARGCPGFPWLDERFHPFPSTPTFPLLFPEPTTPGPIPHPARLPPATTTKSKSLFLAPRTVVHTAPHQYSRLSRASASLPWPLHVIPSADTKTEIHPSTRAKRPTELRLLRVSCRNWARLERPHISTAFIWRPPRCFPRRSCRPGPFDITQGAPPHSTLRPPPSSRRPTMPPIYR